MSEHPLNSGPPYYVPWSPPIDRMATTSIPVDAPPEVVARAVEMLVAKLGRMTPEGIRPDWARLMIAASGVQPVPGSVLLFAKVTDRA